MNGKKCLLDTNIIIDLFAGDNTIAKAAGSMNQIMVPAIVAGELYYGAENSNKKAKHTNQVESFLETCTLLEVNIETAKHYASIKSQLKKQGKPIPENDIWIAAMALQYNLKLITKDKHFNLVEKLKVEEW